MADWEAEPIDLRMRTKDSVAASIIIILCLLVVAIFTAGRALYTFNQIDDRLTAIKTVQSAIQTFQCKEVKDGK